MKSSLNRTVDIIGGLVQKCVVINDKIKQNTLNQQNYQEFYNRLDNLQKLLDSKIPQEEIGGEIMLIVSGLESVLGEGTVNESNGTWMNGEYYLVDKTAIGTARAWKHKDYESVIKVAGSPIQYWAICPTDTSTSFEIFISNATSGNVPTDSPYDENTLSSLVWSYRGNYASSVSVVAQIISDDSSGGDSEGDSGNDNTDCYIVSGAGSSEYNGVYTYLDETDGYPRYSCLGTDGSTMMYIQYITALARYGISAMENKPAYYSYSETDITGAWLIGIGTAPAPTVTKSRAEWSITNAGTTAVNGTYALIDDTENNEIWSNGTYKLSKIYVNVLGEATTYYIYPISAGLLPSAANHTYYGYKSGGNYKPNEVAWTVGTGSMAGIAPVPTFTVIGSGDSENGSENTSYYYKVSGSSMSNVDGNYYETDMLFNGNIVYKHETNEIYLRKTYQNWQITTLATDPETTALFYTQGTDVSSTWHAVAGTPPTVVLVES